MGEAPFSTRGHVFQNMGDGTYNHSGLMAIRHAVGTGTTITYKILFNDAVAMTGGQRNDGGLTVEQIASQMRAIGVERIAVVSDEPDKYPSRAAFPAYTSFNHRSELQAVQTELMGVKGVTVLIYDQTCAAEKRRRRRKGEFPDPSRRVFINELVCEGCGDCGVQSNCVAIQPVETEFGRKRKIDQSSCNKDFSCLKGFCPSFVTVEGGELVKGTSGPAVDLDKLPFPPVPEPVLPSLEKPWSILVTGIGGTGVVTIGHHPRHGRPHGGQGCGPDRHGGHLAEERRRRHPPQDRGEAGGDFSGARGAGPCRPDPRLRSRHQRIGAHPVRGLARRRPMRWSTAMRSCRRISPMTPISTCRVEPSR